MSLIGLTGAHGTGKSTIIRGVKEFGVRVIESSLSRSAQAALGWENLKPAEESEEKMWQLQEAILASMYDRDLDVLGSFHFTLVDRTPADVWSYVDLWTHRLAMKGVMVDEDHKRDFKHRCQAMAARYSHHIIVPISEAVPFVAEANRADLAGRDFHEKAVCQFVITGGLSHMVLLQTGIDERVRKVAKIVNSLQHSNRLFQTYEEKSSPSNP